MKLAKLSLAAIVVAGLASSSFAADTLADAFKNGKVNGELKAYYFTNDNGTSKEDIFTTGATLGYKTASFYGLTLGLTAQSSASPFADGTVGVDGGKDRFSGSMYGSGAVLSEAYVAYNIGKTTAMVGRMYLDTPLVATSGSRVVKDSFEGAAVINTDLPNTTLIAGYVQKYQDRTDSEGNIGKFTKSFGTGSGNSAASYGIELDDGAYTLAVINKSIAGLTLTGAYAYANDIISIYYAEALYEGKTGEIGYTLGGQYYYNKFDSSLGGDNSINSYALKAGLGYKGINGTVAYSQTSNDNVTVGTLISGLGNGADLLYTDPVIAPNTGYLPDTKAYMADLNYDLTTAANIGVRYVEVKDDLNALKYSYSSIYGSYKFEGALKGFSLGAQFESQGKDADGDDLWVKANYKF